MGAGGGGINWYLQLYIDKYILWDEKIACMTFLYYPGAWAPARRLWRIYTIWVVNFMVETVYIKLEEVKPSERRKKI